MYEYTYILVKYGITVHKNVLKFDEENEWKEQVNLNRGMIVTRLQLK